MSRHILSVSYDEQLLTTRRMLLEREGYKITSALSRAEAVARCKEGAFDLLILGHGLLGETLLKQRLLDVIDIAIHPVLVGHGKSIFREGQAVKLKLAATRSFSKIVKVSYEPQY